MASLEPFMVRIGNLELSTCDKHLTQSGTLDHAEICQWGDKNGHKWTIAYFQPHSEGYDLKFVGERPLVKGVRWLEFKKLVRLGYDLLRKR